jgi:hypothetical protein
MYTIFDVLRILWHAVSLFSNPDQPQVTQSVQVSICLFVISQFSGPPFLTVMTASAAPLSILWISCQRYQRLHSSCLCFIWGEVHRMNELCPQRHHTDTLLQSSEAARGTSIIESFKAFLTGTLNAGKLRDSEPHYATASCVVWAHRKLGGWFLRV